MVIESRLSRAEYARVLLFRRFTNPTFYLFAFIAAGLTAYAVTQATSPVVGVVAWVPIALYLGTAVYAASIGSRGPNRPFLQMTRYEFGKDEVQVSTRLGEGSVAYRDIRLVRKILGCYVFDLVSGQFFAIPQGAVTGSRVGEFERLVRERIRMGPII